MTAISVSLLGRLILFGFGVAVHGLVFPGPRPTDDFLAAQLNGADTDGWSPKPTPGPKHHEVLERQLDEAAVALAAPDNTCGFLFGRQGGSIVCPGSTSQCVFVTASGDKAGSVDCCDDKSCNVRIKSCVDENNIDGCDKDCLTDPLILKCTRSFARYCNTMTWPVALGLGDFEDFYCGAKKTRGPQSVDTSYTGQRSRSLTEYLLVPAQTAPRSPTTSSASKKSSSTRSSESQPDDFEGIETISSEPIPEPGSTTINTADRAATGSVAPAVAPAGGSKSDVGAIVGGIVGAIAAIAMIVLGLFFLRRQKKKKGDPPMSIPSAIPPQQPPPMSEQRPQPPSQPPVVSPFADPPQHTQRYPVPPPLVIPPATPTSSEQRPLTSSRYSPVSETIIAALAAIPDTAKKSPNYPKSPDYPGPSPMSTPPGSPKPPNYQPFQPSNTYYPNQPQYRPSPTSSTPTHMRDYSEVGPVEIQQAWITPAPPSQDDSNSPSSAFNAFPVSPVSALSANPPEHHQRIGVPGVPLILQPGLGMQRLPPGTVRQVTVQRGASRRGQNPRRESQAPQSPAAR